MKRNLYQYIGVESNASEQEISLACQKRIAQCEALIEKGEKRAQTMLMIVKDAQRILLSEEKRYLYDKKLADKKPTTEENKPKTKESYMQEPENNFLVNNPDIMIGISFFLSWLFIFLGNILKKTFEVGAFISAFAAFFCIICFSLLCHKENCKEQERKASEIKNKKERNLQNSINRAELVARTAKKEK